MYPLRWLLLVGGCVLTLCVVDPASAQSDRFSPARARRDLDDARARWGTNAILHYRLRVAADNPLMRSVTESDVRNGSVLVARGSSGMPGFGPPAGSNWGPSDGQTVETLFQLIEAALQRPGEEVWATYDARRGYPTRIGTGPAMMTFDAYVSFTIELIESPAVPLVAPFPGEAFRSPWPARLVDPDVMYSTPFGFGSNEAERVVRRVWPNRADEITSRAVESYWASVGWQPRAGLVGDIIGTLTLPSGVTVCVLEFRHNGGTLFALVEKSGVQPIR